MTQPAIHKRWLVSVATPLLVALIFVGLTKGNHSIFPWFNGWGQWSPVFWSCMTLLGDTLVLFSLLLLFVGRRPDVVWSVIIAAVIVSLAVQGIKPYLDLPRPPAVLTADQLHTIGYIATSGSFPSGHTAAAFTLAGTLSMLSFPRWFKACAVVLAVLVAISRMAVGIHWPMDVLGGALIGWLAAALGIWLASLSKWGLGLTSQRVFAVLLLAANGLLLFAGDLGYPLGLPLLHALPFVLVVFALPGLRRLVAGKTE